MHGWLYLPEVNADNNGTTLHGYFVHHTPGEARGVPSRRRPLTASRAEFFHLSPHNFEIVVRGVLTLNRSVDGLPFPRARALVGTEYVLSPPAFSLDALISGTLTSIGGPFANGSFDTPQRYTLSDGQLAISELVTVHYLSAAANATYAELPYYSYPRNARAARADRHHNLYMMHLLEASPDFDQVLHAVLDLHSCVYAGSDGPRDVLASGATWVVPKVRPPLNKTARAKRRR